MSLKKQRKILWNNKRFAKMNYDSNEFIFIQNDDEENSEK